MEPFNEFKLFRDTVIIKNSKGERIQVDAEEWNEYALNPITNHPFEDYELDVDYYLSHGFTEVHEAFRQIESGELRKNRIK